MAQQGYPPRRAPGQPDSGQPGSGQPDSGPQGRDDRGSRPERPRRPRPERHDRPGWQQFDAFDEASDGDLPPWAGPVYPQRPAGPLRRTAGARAGVGEHPADSYATGRPSGGRPSGGRHSAGPAEEYAGQDGDGWYDEDYPAAEPELAEPELAGPELAGPERAEPERAERGPVESGSEIESATEPGHGRLLPGRRRGRAAATRLRKSRRRVYRWCGTAIVICIVAAGITALVTQHAPKKALYVTALQHGEFKSVPGACASVSTAMLNQYLPASGRTTSNELSGSTDSECSFTVDSKPTFLVLEVAVQAYQPFAAATGNGSATANAQDNFATAEQGLAHPPRKSPLPPAQISALAGTGQQAVRAVQAEHANGGISTDLVTVLIRERNVIITVSLAGQESGHGFGPVPVTTLAAGAEAAARDVLALAVAQPTA